MSIKGDKNPEELEQKIEKHITRIKQRLADDKDFTNQKNPDHKGLK